MGAKHKITVIYQYCHFFKYQLDLRSKSDLMWTDDGYLAAVGHFIGLNKKVINHQISAIGHNSSTNIVMQIL